MTRWKSFSVRTRREAVDAVTQFFVAHGSLGTAYDEQLLGAEGDPADPIPPPPKVTRLTAYFPWDTDLHLLKQAFLDLLPVLSESFGPGPEAFSDATEITDTGWAEKWKEHFHPRKVGRKIVIKPSWETVEAGESDIVLTVDPGQAFGTGTHETTRLCLRMIEDVFDLSPPPRDVLDVGTGTGILAIAAVKLGASHAAGTDTDDWALENATENVLRNEVAENVTISRQPLTHFPSSSFNLLCANLTLNTNLAYLGEFKRVLLPDGILILSGLLRNDREEMLKGLDMVGFSVIDERAENEWIAIAAQAR